MMGIFAMSSPRAAFRTVVLNCTLKSLRIFTHVYAQTSWNGFIRMSSGAGIQASVVSGVPPVIPVGSLG